MAEIDMVGPDEIKAWREMWAKDIHHQVPEIRRAAWQKIVMCDLALDGIKYRQRLIPEETRMPTSAYKDLNGDIFIVMLDGGVHQWRKGEGWLKVGSLPSRVPQSQEGK